MILGPTQIQVVHAIFDLTLSTHLQISSYISLPSASHLLNVTSSHFSSPYHLSITPSIPSLLTAIITITIGKPSSASPFATAVAAAVAYYEVNHNHNSDHY